VVLGLAFLMYINAAFAERRAQLAADLAAEGFDDGATEELLESRDEYTAKGVFWMPPEARWPYLQASGPSRPRSANWSTTPWISWNSTTRPCVVFSRRPSPGPLSIRAAWGN